MGKNNTPFNREIFAINAVDTANVTSVTDNFKFLAVPIRYNVLTALNFKTTALPSNDLSYNAADGGIMKVFDLSNENDLDKYFVADSNKALYSSLKEMMVYAGSPVSMKVFLLDLEDEVVVTDIPNVTEILKYIHTNDAESLPYKKMTKAKDQLNSLGYMLKGMPLLGVGETVDPDVASTLAPDLLSLNLLAKPGNTPVVPADLLPADKAGILKSSININYNIQDDEDLVFELLVDGNPVAIGDIDPATDVDLIEASTVELKYKKSNGLDVTVTIPAMKVDGTTNPAKCFLKAPATQLVDFDQSKIVSITFSASNVPAKYTLDVDSAPTSKEYTEKFNVKTTFDSTDVKVIVSNQNLTLLTSPEEVISIAFDSAPELQAKFGFIFGEKESTPVSTDVMKYLYVKLAEIKIASAFGSSVNECQTIIDVAATAVIGGTVFSYDAPISENLYDKLKKEADSNPISFTRDYYSDNLASKAADLTVDDIWSVSFAALAKFYSLTGTNINYSYDLYGHDLTFSDSFKDKIKLPTVYDNQVRLPYGNLMQVVPTFTRGLLYYYCDNAKSMVTTSGVYNQPKDLFIKAYSYYQFNINITSTLVLDLVSDTYSSDMVDFLNDAIANTASNINTVFKSNIEELSVTELIYSSQQSNPYLVTSVVDGISTTTFDLGKIAVLGIKGLVDKYVITYERQIQG